MTWAKAIPAPTSQHPVTAAHNGPVFHVDIFCASGSDDGTARIFVEFFEAANDILTGARYSVSLRTLSMPLNEDPRKWHRRTAIFAGNMRTRWRTDENQRQRLARIMHLASKTVLVGGGVFLLRDAGLNENCPVAVHGNFAAAATEERLETTKPAATAVRSGRILSAVTGFAAMPLMLDLFANDHGPGLASQLSDHLGVSAPERPNRSQQAQAMLSDAGGDALIRSGLEIMQDHIEEPLQIRDIACELGVSTRKLERRFQDKTGVTPLTAYRQLRIERARQLVVQTGLSPAEIAAATGFGTRANLSHWLRKCFGAGPSELRRQWFQQPMASEFRN